MSKMKMIYEDIAEMVLDGWDDKNIIEMLSERYGINFNEGDWLIKQIATVRDEVEVYD